MIGEKFIWNDAYKVEVNEIDEQHKHFFEIANSIFGLINDGNVLVSELIPKINELGDYALYHLSAEESYFDRFHYKEAEPHVSEHNLFRQKIIEYMKKAKSQETNTKNMAGEVASFAVSWLKDHILKVDKKYIKLFHDHGLN